MSLNDYWLLSLPFVGAMLGIMFTKFFPLKKTLGLKLILSFSGAFLLGITVFELFPEIFSKGSKQLSIYVMGGILFQIVLTSRSDYLNILTYVFLIQLIRLKVQFFDFL